MTTTTVVLPDWAKQAIRLAVSVAISVIALAGWTYTRGASEATAASTVSAIERRLHDHVTDRDVHFGRNDAERLARVEEGVDALKQGVAELKSLVERR